MSAGQWFYWFSARGWRCHLAASDRWVFAVTLCGLRTNRLWSPVSRKSIVTEFPCARCDAARKKLERKP